MKLKSTLIFLLFLCYSVGLQAQCYVTATVVNNSICGLCNGTVSLAFSGGTPPYAVNFNGIPTGTSTSSLNIPNLCPGTYSFSVTDAMGTLCTGLLTISISTQGNPLSASILSVNPTCPTCTDGSATAYVTGGTPPYTYWWSNGANTPVINGLGTGIYYLYVMDANGCSDTDTVSINYGGLPLYLISGRAFYDINGDGFYNYPDAPLNYQQIMKQPSGQITYTDANGYYTFADTAGSYQLSYVPAGYYHTVTPNYQHQVTITGANQSGFDFPLQPDSMYHDLSVYTFIPSPRCNTLRTYYTVITNNGTYIDSGNVTFAFDSVLSPAAWSSGGIVNGKTITYPFFGLAPTETRTLATSFILPGPNDTLMRNTVGYLIDAGGTILDSSSSSGYDVVLCSYDPNDKQVDPVGEGPGHLVPMNTELRYLIRFQNTGNDTAYNIMVADTIDPGIDLNTVYVIATSHPAYFLKDGGNVLKVYFDNIYLPDSTTDEDASHGYILFRCFGNSSNPDPTVVTNSAAIVFDSNPPVLTNAVFNTLSNAAISVEEPSVTENGITLMPNPAENYTLVMFEKYAGQELRFNVYSINGAEIQSGELRNGSTLLDTHSWNAGLYLIRITDTVSGKASTARLSVR